MKIANTILAKVGPDGLMHFAISATAAALINLFTPWYATAAIVMAAGIGKEVYDKVSARGCCEWKDILCDAVGCIIGII